MSISSLKGVVLSAKNDKTITVVIEYASLHSKMRKVMFKKKKIRAHDENNSCSVGDFVLISSCRPISATKRWRLVERLCNDI